MGNCFTVPLLSGDRTDLLTLSNQGFSLVAAALSPRAVSLRTFKPSYPLVLVVGNEGYGLPANALDLCATEVKIPMANDLDSFNVVVAASICMYALFAPPGPENSSGQ
jgi:TrmH family RNA methyltransferase